MSLCPFLRTVQTRAPALADAKLLLKVAREVLSRKDCRLTAAEHDVVLPALKKSIAKWNRAFRADVKFKKLCVEVLLLITFRPEY